MIETEDDMTHTEVRWFRYLKSLYNSLITEKKDRPTIGMKVELTEEAKEK
ncbi:MAG: hypothetical protein GY861_15550 [bacterium]|nr:hypothetical protein [bacterium]